MHKKEFILITKIKNKKYLFAHASTGVMTSIYINKQHYMSCNGHILAAC